MKLHIKDEISTLKAVVLGQPGSLGPVPKPEQTFDAKSYESAVNGVYPTEQAVYNELGAFGAVLLRHGVEVYRPTNIDNYNQVFARNVAAVIDDKMLHSNNAANRKEEKEAYKSVYDKINPDKMIELPEKAQFEGGDVVLMNETVFVGLYSGSDYPQLKSARTNRYAFDVMKELFPQKFFVPIELHKHDTDPRKGVLHLDCAFMPVGRGRAIICPDGFANKNDYYKLAEMIGSTDIFNITAEEMYMMNTNVFSISPDVVVSGKNFTRLNNHMEKEWGMTVERVACSEIAKMGGLLRSSTLPLIRE